ncbi:MULTISPECIES: MFS transporter [unclassified Streptomyces]|uniref:MFS transporter n=1 Tax=unclassified Streptomyces TaxID=2593676 RepID=UPI0035DCE292
MKAARSGRPALPSLWRDGDFRRLWAGQTASQLGAQAAQVVLPLIAVVTLDAGAAEVGVMRAVEQAPILLISLFAGAWVDRRRSRDVMVLADFGRALALAAIPAAYLLGLLGAPALLGVAFLVGVLSVFFDVAYQAFLVRLVRREQLVQGNSLLQGSRSAAQIGGPALGGVLVSSAVLADGVMLCVPLLRGSTAATVPLLMAVNFLFGAFGQTVDVTVMTVRQAITPVRMQGRVVATINFVGMGLTPLGSLLGGCLADQWGLRTGLLLTAIGLSLSPLCMALSPLARLGKELPECSAVAQKPGGDASHRFESLG